MNAGGGAPSTLSLVAKSSSDDPAPCFRKGSKFCYTLDFLLSIGKLDRCQRLPCNLDSVILCGLNEAPQQIRLPSPINSRTIGFSKWDFNYVRSPPNSSPESGILGKGALPRAPYLPSFATVPKTQETTSCHLLARSATPYRPPHLYKSNVHPEIDDGGVKAFDTSEVNRAMKTEKERQNEASERQAIQETEVNDSSVLQKENLDPSNTPCTSDFKKHSSPLEESGNPAQIKNHAFKVDQNTKLSSHGILPLFREVTEGKLTSHNTAPNKQQLTITCDGSNGRISEFKASTYPSAAEEVFKQLREWDKSTKQRQENSGITLDAGSSNLLALLEESTCVDSLVAAFCVCDENEEDSASILVPTRLSFPDECQSTEVDEPSCCMKPCETRLEISTEEGSPVLVTGDEICWPDEDALITVHDFICGKAGKGDETMFQSVTNSEDGEKKKTPPLTTATTPASKATKSNRNQKRQKPPMMLPPFLVFNPPPPFCPFPQNRMDQYTQFHLPHPPFGFPNQIYGNLSDLSSGGGGDLGMMNSWPFDEQTRLAGGVQLGWPWFGNNT
ncbi:hypothetical protein LINPERPRIM_LOCUS11970 [Linum perenne]